MSEGKSIKDTIKELLCFAGAIIIAFLSIYLFSGDRGAWQGVPLILFAPAISSIYNNRKAIYVLYGYLALAVSIYDKAQLSFSLKYTAVVLVIAFVSIFVKRMIVTGVTIKGKRGLAFLLGAVVLTGASLFAYADYNGTYFGNINASKENIASFEQKYADCEIEFTIGNTYYSHTAGGYLTEMSFYHREQITASYGANTKSGVVDGYRNYCASLMMEERANDLGNLLSYHYRRDIDFAVRYDEMKGDDLLLPYSREDDYAHLMSFDIAFYDVIESKEAFAKLCEEYFSHIESGKFEYDSITFYGGNEKGFKYQITLEKGSGQSVKAENVMDFDKRTFKKYTSESDIKEYWR